MTPVTIELSSFESLEQLHILITGMLSLYSEWGYRGKLDFIIKIVDLHTIKFSVMIEENT